MIFPTVPIEDVCALIVDCVNKTAPKVSFKTPWKMLRTPNIRHGRINVDDVFYVDQKTFETWTRRASLAVGDTILTREAPVGEVGLVREAEGFFLGQRLMQYRSNPKIMDGLFLHYAMRSPFLSEQFHAFGGTGSVVDHLKVPDCRKFMVPLPPLSEQREIAGVLGALDDKIEMNRKTAATLEAMARALYRSWFVDFDPVWARLEGRAPAHMDPTTAALFPDRFTEDGLPEGWRMGTLGEVARNPRQGADPASIDPETPYIGLEHIPRKSIAISDWGIAEDVGSTKSTMKTGQFLFGKLRPYFHKVGLVPVDGICSTDILVVEAKTDPWREYVLSVISSVDLVDHVNAASTGTRMPRAKWQDLADYGVVIAPPVIIAAFSQIVRPMHQRILSVIEENQTLASLRDSLLPRLMSGELHLGHVNSTAGGNET
ncbi:restriction endonuclease subunit S [Rhodobacter capsulatus]|uniref:restriction endonuclease subunit S n=1 Tax=Rhodobacter capsulatus TaxID=1061 RepID=UPI00402795A3